MKSTVDVSDWPLDGTQWIAKSAEALRTAGITPDALEVFTRRMSGARSFGLVCEGCVAALRQFYDVKGA